MLKNAIHNLACNKANARIVYLQFDIESLKRDIKSKITGGITMQELKDVHKGTIKELEIWRYIYKILNNIRALVIT